MVLTRQQARKFYDRFGKKQDTQAFYEDAALGELIAHAAFDRAEYVFELGCGTGRFARRLLAEHLPRSARYFGIDISSTMIAIAEKRVSPFGERATVNAADGASRFPLGDGSVDRVVSAYVLDLLSEEDIQQVVLEARRVLTPGGKLCLVSLTEGGAALSRIVCALWSALFRLSATLVGGCRPIRLESFLYGPGWSVEYHNVVRQFGVPSEILIAGHEAAGAQPAHPKARGQPQRKEV